jgi:hypothetical protein
MDLVASSGIKLIGETSSVATLSAFKFDLKTRPAAIVPRLKPL